MEMKPYSHKIQYYETDQMKIVHHSNYIRWFEEARTYYLEEIGIPYDEMERCGILCPVLEAGAKYLRMMKFGDIAHVEILIKEYNGIKLIIEYQVIGEKSKMVHCKGETAHCFMTELGRPFSLKKNYPEYHKVLIEALEESEVRRQRLLEDQHRPIRRIYDPSRGQEEKEEDPSEESITSEVPVSVEEITETAAAESPVTEPVSETEEVQEETTEPETTEPETDNSFFEFQAEQVKEDE